MAPIIRSPSLSSKSRTLNHRRLLGKDELRAPEAHSHARPASADHCAGSPLAHVSHPSPHSGTPGPASRTSGPGTNDINAVVEKARQSVLEQFKKDAEAARELGRQRGLQEGRQTGIEEAKKEFAVEMERIRAIADSMQHAVAAKVQGVEDVVVEIVFETVCKILGAQVLAPESIKSMVQQAASGMARTERVSVRMHPSDLTALRNVGVLDSVLGNAKQVSWLADKTMTLGGCVVETDSGGLDARLETQIARLKETLIAARAVDGAAE